MKHAAPADQTPAPASSPETTARRRFSAPKIIGIVAGSIVGLLLIAYVAGSLYFTDRFMPNTVLGDHDVSLKTSSEVQAILDDALSDYTVAVSGQGFSMKLSAKDAGVSFDGQAIVADALGNTNPWLWPLEIAREHDETDSLAASSGSGLANAVRTATDPKLQAAAEAANQLVKADMQLMMGGDVAAEVNPALVSTWISFDENLTPSLDEEALIAWAKQLEAACDTVGTERTYTRPDGKVITVAGGPYGWLTDGEALLELVKEGVANGTVGAVDIPCKTTGTAYNGAGAQDWSARYCDIDLSEQHVRFYDETGTLIWEAPCVSGTPNGAHNTPTGVFWLNQKASPSVLKGTNLDGSKYESAVRYWMPFVGNVIGLHDADWQAAFGSTLYQQGRGSHGCVNLPVGSAADLFGIIQSGDVVVCHW